MAQQIVCKTLFDITETGVRSHYKNTLLPFRDAAGNSISDLESWTKSRNQQRNWETINQIISLRSLPENISTPVQHNTSWSFTFEVPTLAAFETAVDSLGLLKSDAQGVPMITNLTETSELVPYIVTQGEQVNCWFELNISNEE